MTPYYRGRVFFSRYAEKPEISESYFFLDGNPTCRPLKVETDRRACVPTLTWGVRAQRRQSRNGETRQKAINARFSTGVRQ